MRRGLLALATLAVLLSGCGKTATDADIQTASAAMGNFGNMGVTQSAFARVRRELDGKRACTPSGPFSSAGFSFTVTCPSTTRFSVAITSTAEFTRTCGTKSFSGRDMTATILYEPATNAYTLDMDVSAVIGDVTPSKSLVCKANLSVSLSRAASTAVSEAGYACTIDGATIPREKFDTVTCVL